MYIYDGIKCHYVTGLDRHSISFFQTISGMKQKFEGQVRKKRELRRTEVKKKKIERTTVSKSKPDMQQSSLTAPPVCNTMLVPRL